MTLFAPCPDNDDENDNAEKWASYKNSIVFSILLVIFRFRLKCTMYGVGRQSEEKRNIPSPTFILPLF